MTAGAFPPPSPNLCAAALTIGPRSRQQTLHPSRTDSASSAGAAIACLVSPGKVATRASIEDDRQSDSRVFVIDGDMSVRESLEPLISNGRLDARKFRVGKGIPIPLTRRDSVLRDPRPDTTWLEWSAVADAASHASIRMTRRSPERSGNNDSEICALQSGR